MAAERIERLVKRDEVAGDEFRALMNQLVERMLPVSSGLAPEDRPGLIVHGRAVERDVLAVGFHRELLQIGRKALQILLVRKNADRLRAEEVVVPDRKQPHDHRQVASRTARCGSARRSHGSRRASRESSPARPRSWSKVRSRSPSNSVRRPSPRSRTCFACRCRTCVTSAALVETATKCFAIAFSSPRASRLHLRALCALVIVSSVVKVFDEMMNRVSAGSRSRVASAKSVPSTLETKRMVRLRSL